MLDPPPTIEFLKLRACSVRIKGCHALNGARAAIQSDGHRTGSTTVHVQNL